MHETEQVSALSHLAIVDDDMSVLRSLSRMLGACGYAITAFQSAEMFLESLAHGPPDAVLVDLRLPGTDGLALMEHLHKDGHRIPMVFLSGHADIPTSVRAIRSGAVDFLEKPCDESTLLTSLARAFDIARSNRTVAATSEELHAKWQTLTPREQQVCYSSRAGALEQADRRRSRHTREDDQGASGARDGEDGRAFAARAGALDRSAAQGSGRSHGGIHAAGDRARDAGGGSHRRIVGVLAQGREKSARLDRFREELIAAGGERQLAIIGAGERRDGDDDRRACRRGPREPCARRPTHSARA